MRRGRSLRSWSPLLARATGPARAAELGLDVADLEVLGELAAGGVLWKSGREGDPGQLAELLGELELEAFVGTPLPEGGDAVLALQDEEVHALLAEAGRDGEPRGPVADDDGSVDPPVPRGEEALHEFTREEHHGCLLALVPG